MNTNDRAVPSKFVIDVTVPDTQDSPTVTRRRPTELQVVGCSIINPLSQVLAEQSAGPALELMTSSDNERGLAARSREAREKFLQKLSKLRDESQISLAYLDSRQLQTNQVPNPELPLLRLTSSDTEMYSNGNGDEELDSSYFFPNSQHPIACNGTFEISPSHRSIDPLCSPDIPPVIDSDVIFLNEVSFTPEDVTRNVTTNSSVERDSPGNTHSPYQALRSSLSDPHLFSLDSLILQEPDNTSPRIFPPPLRKRSLSDTCLTKLPTESEEALLYQEQIPPNRAIHSSEMDLRAKSTGKPVVLSGQSPKIIQAVQSEIENESQLANRISAQESEVDNQGVFNSTLSEEYVPEYEYDPRSDLQEVSDTDDPIILHITKDEEVYDPEDIQKSHDINQQGLIPDSFFSKEPDIFTIGPPILTENEPQTSKAFESQSRELVDNMWNEFSFSQYFTQTPKPKKNLRNTTPYPFSVYYKSLEPKKKTAAQLEGEAKRRLELESEQFECSRKFYSRPVPKSTHEPRYQEILSREENRRQQARNISKETLQSIVKPFKFDARDSVSRRGHIGDSCSVESGETRFRAKPVPKHLFQTRYQDEVAEQDLYRGIRKVMRTNKLLSTSRLPRSMSASERSLSYTDGQKRRMREENNSKQAFLTAEHKFKPTVNKRMPDFRRQQELFEQQMSERKEEQRITRIEFSDQELTGGDLEIKASRNFEITIPSVSDVLRATADQKVQAKSREYKSQKADGVYGHAPTKSTRLRQYLVQQRINEQVLKERDERERAAQQTQRARKIKRQVAEGVRKLDNSELMEIRADDKMKHFREMEESRQIEYREHLKMIKKRLEERPLVFERVAQETAKDRIVNKFNSLLRKSGISEDKMNETFSKSSLSRSYTVSIT